jgi:hypothetical protein
MVKHSIVSVETSIHWLLGSFTCICGNKHLLDHSVVCTFRNKHSVGNEIISIVYLRDVETRIHWSIVRPCIRCVPMILTVRSFTLPALLTASHFAGLSSHSVPYPVNGDLSLCSYLVHYI